MPHLEIAAADEQVNLLPLLALQHRHGLVDLVQLAMTTSLHCYLQQGQSVRRRSGTGGRRPTFGRRDGSRPLTLSPRFTVDSITDCNCEGSFAARWTHSVW